MISFDVGYFWWREAREEGVWDDWSFNLEFDCYKCTFLLSFEVEDDLSEPVRVFSEEVFSIIIKKN